MGVFRRFGGRRRGTCLVAACAAWLVTACGGDSNSISPREGCQTFIDGFCSRAAECELPSARADAYQDCKLGFELDLDCAAVDALGPRYTECIEALPKSSCEAIQTSLPMSCQGVLLF